MKFILCLLLALGIGVAAAMYTATSSYYSYEELSTTVGSVEFLYSEKGSDKDFEVLLTLSGEQDDEFLEELSKVEFQEYGILSCVEPPEFGGMAVKLVYTDNSSEIICITMTKYYDAEGKETDRKWKNCLQSVKEWEALFAPYVEYIK